MQFGERKFSAIPKGISLKYLLNSFEIFEGSNNVLPGYLLCLWNLIYLSLEIDQTSKILALCTSCNSLLILAGWCFLCFRKADA